MEFAYEYSEKEIELFKGLDLIDLLRNPSSPAVLTYYTAGYACFIKEGTSDAFPQNLVESIRRCNQWLGKGVNRLTKEFDDLIEL